MRRSQNMNRGSGGGYNLAGSGPLLTEHLKDIDLELELLKRKREMIEQQQFRQPYTPKRNYSQQSFSYRQNEPNHGGSNYDFSYLYNDGPQQYQKSSFGKKRQSDSDWQHESYPKRSSGGQRSSNYVPPSGRNQRSFSGPAHAPKNTPFKYNQGKQFGGPKSNQKPQKPAFVGNKITKPNKASEPPNKIASKPLAERKDLVALALESVAEAQNREKEALRLHPDKEPTKQMIGRLELALGAIIRDVREICAKSPHDTVLKTVTLQRVIKQAIRERIRNAMLGKIVGTSKDIIMTYRNMYPKETDTEIINIALEAAGLEQMTPDNVLIVPRKEKPDEYFRANMMKLIDCHLNEMFSKIEEIYNPPGALTEVKQIDFTEDVTTGDEVKSTEVVEEAAAASNETANVVTDNASANETPNDAVNGTDTETIASETANDTANSTINETANSSVNDSVNDTSNPDNTVETAEAIAAKLENANPNEYKRMMPRLLKRHIPTIIRLLHLNEMYRSTICDIAANTKVKYANYHNKNHQTNQSAGNQSESGNGTSQTPKKYMPGHMLPYYVKVMGKPQLPKKKVMHTFLDVFHPKSIKMHRTIHNLLFIGFSEKSDFDAIVKADGTVIGQYTLSIRVCEKSAGKPDQAKENTDSKQENVDIKADTEAVKEENQTEQTESVEKTETSNEDNVITVNDTEPKAEINDSEMPTEIKDSEVPIEIKDTDEPQDPEPIKPEPQNGEEKPVEEINEEDQVTNGEKLDKVAELKESVPEKAPGTPTRSSSRLAGTPATPSTIRTRRASRLQQN